MALRTIETSRGRVAVEDHGTGIEVSVAETAAGLECELHGGKHYSIYKKVTTHGVAALECAASALMDWCAARGPEPDYAEALRHTGDDLEFARRLDSYADMMTTRYTRQLILMGTLTGRTSPLLFDDLLWRGGYMERVLPACPTVPELTLLDRLLPRRRAVKEMDYAAALSRYKDGQALMARHDAAA